MYKFSLHGLKDTDHKSHWKLQPFIPHYINLIWIPPFITNKKKIHTCTMYVKMEKGAEKVN